MILLAKIVLNNNSGNERGTADQIIQLIMFNTKMLRIFLYQIQMANTADARVQSYSPLTHHPHVLLVPVPQTERDTQSVNETIHLSVITLTLQL